MIRKLHNQQIKKSCFLAILIMASALLVGCRITNGTPASSGAVPARVPAQVPGPLRLAERSAGLAERHDRPHSAGQRRR